MITASYPPFYSMVGNENKLILDSDQYEFVSPVYPVIDVNFSSIPLDGDVLPFSFSGGQSEFNLTFKINPPPNMFRFSTPGSGSIQNFLSNHFVPNLNQNLFILDKWRVEFLEPNAVRFFAQRPGSELEFTLGSNSFATANLVTAGVEPVYLSNLSIFLRLNFRPGGTATWQTRDYQVPTNQGKVTFLLNKMLSQADSLAPLPMYNATSVQNVTNAIIEYELQFTETYAAQLGAGNKLNTVGLFRFFPGGVTETDFAKLDLEGSFDNNNGWLTALQDPIKMVPGQQCYVSYFYNSGSVNAHLRLQLNYTDQSTEQVNLHQNVTLQQNNAYTIPLHYNLINSVADPAKELVSYEVYWVDSNNVSSPLSSKLSFKVFSQNFTELTQLLYRNSFGFYEVAAFTGEVNESFDFETQQINLALPPFYQVTDRSGKNTNSRYRLEKTVNTGYHTKKQIRNLLDLIRSEDVRLITTSAYEPKIIKVPNQELHNTLSGRQNALTIQINTMSKQKYYSNGRHTV